MVRRRGCGGSASRSARRAREPCAQTRTGRSPLPGRGTSTRPVHRRGPAKSSSGQRHSSPISRSFFPLRPSTAAVPDAPRSSVPRSTVTPFGHDRAAEEPPMWLVRVESPWACFGLEVTDDGWIIQAAPIAAWTIGNRGRQVVAHYRGRGGQVSWLQVPHGSATPATHSPGRPRSCTPPSTSSTLTPFPRPTERSSPARLNLRTACRYRSRHVRSFLLIVEPTRTPRGRARYD
jgi:hypothetical protein